MDEMELLGKTKVRVEGEKAVETGEQIGRAHV